MRGLNKSLRDTSIYLFHLISLGTVMHISGPNILIIIFLLNANSGRIQHTEVCELLRQMMPPVGIGMRCPRIVAYKVFNF